MEKKPRNRFTEKPSPPNYHASDDAIVSALTRGTKHRHPWGYRKLFGMHVGPIIGRNAKATARRVAELSGHPGYTRLATQDTDYYKPLLWEVGSAGLKKVYGPDAKLLPDTGIIPRMQGHDVLADLIALSFELGAREHSLDIDVVEADLDLHPDWHIFKIAGRTVFIEADMGTEKLRSRGPDEDGTTIEQKYEHYLELIRSKTFESPIVIFYTILEGRVPNLKQLLKDVIVKHGYPKGYARAFAFRHVLYDGNFNHVPSPTGWAVTEPYETVAEGIGPFSFLGESNGRQAQPAQATHGAEDQHHGGNRDASEVVG